MNAASERAVCVYCASSKSSHPEYRAAASRLGGRVIGVLPRFMSDLEWGHKNLSELQVVEDMRTRKHRMLALSQAAIALPGGSGTLEELLEAITLKRLGLYVNPIVLVNTRDFFAPLLRMLEHAVDEHFMDPRHRLMWQVVGRAEEVPAALRDAPGWSAEARSFAAV